MKMKKDNNEAAKQFDELKLKNSELLSDLQRTRADFENYRKQIEMQKENERKAVKLATVMKFLPLLDDLDRAIATYAELEPLAKSMEKSLKDLGLTRISSEVGVEFNPDFHEAVTMEGEGEKQVIAETLRPGYLYENEVLRPAMVKVVCQ
ncbi:MAG: nucleotide exchange factor GrpE [Candidatus Saccharibacteria bacterium]|nr:nucleotide exchange factor GrpE [Candidatus Saccharibacteria bacterium]